MTPEEHQMLEDLAKKIAQTPPPVQDAEAEEFIRKNIGKRPDALYLMTQTVLIQNMALKHAQQEIEQWKQRASQAGSAPKQGQGQGAFLGQTGRSNRPPLHSITLPRRPAMLLRLRRQPAGSMFGGGAGMVGFLRSAGTTAAGVAAGALAFEGIRSMFGGAEHMFGFGNQGHMGGSGFFGGGGRGPWKRPS